MSFQLRRTYAEKLVPLEEDEKKHRIELNLTYIDRAQERRLAESEGIDNQGTNAEFEGAAVNFNSLDLALLQKSLDTQSQRQTELQKIREFSLKEKGKLQSQGKANKNQTNQMGIRIQTFFSESSKLKKNISQTFYEYEMDNVFAKSLPQIITRQQEDIEQELLRQKCKVKDTAILLIEQTLLATCNLSVPRQQQLRSIALDKKNQMDSDDDDIFNDVYDKAKFNQNQQQQQQIQDDPEPQFDPREYLKEMQDENNMLHKNNAEQELQEQLKEKERLEKEKKIKKLLQRDEDYYLECFPKHVLSLEEEKAKKEEMEKQQELNPQEKQLKEDIDKALGKNHKKKGKFKKKRENFNQQLDDIEKVLYCSINLFYKIIKKRRN